MTKGVARFALAGGGRAFLRVYEEQTLATAAGGFLAGVGGSFLSLYYPGSWSEGLSSGQGLMAVALVIFARWNPIRCVLAALVFGGAKALGPALQSVGISNGHYLFDAAPPQGPLVEMPTEQPVCTNCRCVLRTPDSTKVLGMGLDPAHTGLLVDAVGPQLAIAAIANASSSSATRPVAPSMARSGAEPSGCTIPGTPIAWASASARQNVSPGSPR